MFNAGMKTIFLQTKPYILNSEDGQMLQSLGALISIKANSEQTGGAFDLFDAVCPPGFTTPLHIHYAEDVAVFVLEGALIGVVGAAAGVVTGLLINGIFAKVGMDYGDFSTVTEYMALINSRIYPSLGLNNVGWRAATVVIISTLAAFIPAREASHREPAEALHYV